MDLQIHSASLVAVYALLLMVFVQGLVASVAHRKQNSYVPGIVDPSLGPESFVFRSNRTLINSIENVPFMIALIFLAMFVAVNAFALSIISWVYVVGRLGQMITYYLVATRKNPSLRSYFYMIAFFAQAVLLGMVPFRLF